MLSVKVYTAKNQVAISIFSKLVISGQNECSLSNSETVRSQEEKRIAKISIEYNDNILNDQLSSHNPTQCCSHNIDGELVLANDQPNIWSCSSYLTDCGICYTRGRHYQQFSVPKRKNLTAVQDNCSFNVNCVAVQESFKT